MTRIYFDHNATSPLRPEARAAMLRCLDGPANASSVHAEGHAARIALETARAEVAGLIGAAEDEILFTSGGTESNNLAVLGAALRGPAPGARRVVTSAFEHPSVLGPCEDLEGRGFEVVRVRPDRRGVVAAAEVLQACADGAAVVSLMLANNEVGTLQPVAEVARGLRGRGIPVHCDAVQAAGRIPVDVRDLGVDLLSMSAHKCGGPPGAGALFVRRGVELRPLARGGRQERGRRPGTENVPAIAGFGAAAAVAQRALAVEAARLRALRDDLEEMVVRVVPGTRVNCRETARLPNTTSLAVAGVDGETLVIGLDLEGFAVSAGSACSSGTLRRSHVLEAIDAGGAAGVSIRISLGPANEAADVAALVEALGRVAERARRAAVVTVQAGRDGGTR